MIREISSLSGGATIKIITDKEKERNMDETIALITGTKEMKSEAASLIAEKIATFRYAAQAYFRFTQNFI